jgi:alkylated DNA repair dioxygenase AlkB
VVSGLQYIPRYLDAATHDRLLAAADEGDWLEFPDRRMQIFGYSYTREKGMFRIGDLPLWGQTLAARLERDGITPYLADQLVANDYAAGRGIAPHIDGPFCTDTIVSISLGSSCIMEFTNESGGHEEQFLEPMSALIMAGEARLKWKHAIPARTQDSWSGRDWPRGRRISLTFRKMILQNTPSRLAAAITVRP